MDGLVTADIGGDSATAKTRKGERKFNVQPLMINGVALPNLPALQ